MRAGQHDAVLAFNYLHLVRDLPGTLRRIHALLADGGLFISKTPCLGDMNPLIRLALLPAMRAIGKAPYAGAFSASALERQPAAAGFEILATKSTPTAAATGGRTSSRARAECPASNRRDHAPPRKVSIQVLLVDRELRSTLSGDQPPTCGVSSRLSSASNSAGGSGSLS